MDELDGWIQVSGWMDELDGWMERGIDWEDGWMDRQVGGRMGIGVWMDGKDGQMHMDEKVNEQMNMHT